MTTDRLQEDVNFLARRAQRAGSFSMLADQRDWGISSNSLVSLAYGVGPLQMPSDWADYAACERAFAAMPYHRRTPAIVEALELQKAHVAGLKGARR